MRINRDVAAWVIAGVVVGLVGWLLFVSVHAVVIVPIWNRSAGGIPFALIGGLALAGCMWSMRIETFAGAAGFGVFMWLLLLPSTAVAGLLRVLNVRHQMGDWDTVVDLSIAAITGYLAGLLLRHSQRVALALSIGMALLMTAMAGPVPVTNSRRAMTLFVMFLPMFVIGSVVVFVVHQFTLRLASTPLRERCARTRASRR